MKRSDDDNPIPLVLSIAGTDPSGGAGINVDLQVFRDHHCHGLAAISAVVWQNTQRVGGWRALQPAELRAQLDLVDEDLEVAAVKVGMVPTAPLIEEVARFLAQLDERVSVVLDPVMAGGEGEEMLMTDQGRQAVMRLVDCVDLVTPNGPEARALASPENTGYSASKLVAVLLDRGWRRVLLKGGHLQRSGRHSIVDWYGDDSGIRKLEALPAVDVDIRGTGCQLSSAIAARRARATPWADSIRKARSYLSHLLHHRSRVIGGGRPVIVRVEDGQ